jgi:ABC-type proline/glycine betaine transport system permease subunit
MKYRETAAIVGSFIAVLVGVVLTPIIYQQATASNVAGTTATIVSLIPVFFALLVLFAAIKGII